MAVRILIIGFALVAVGGLVGVANGQRGSISRDVEIAGLLADIEAHASKQARLEREVRSVAEARKEALTKIKGRVRGLYRMSRAGMTPISGGFDAMRRHVARVARLKRLVDANATQLRNLNRKGYTLRKETGDVSTDLETSRTRLAQLQADDGGEVLDDFHDVLTTENASFAASDTQSFYGLRLVDDRPLSSFEEMRGSLATPVSGELRVTDARRDESDGPGLEFQAAIGSPVRAAASGRVAFSDRYGSYGRLVILDHGEGFYTVYGGLGAVEVRVGDDLSARARIGSIGSDFTPSALFFEVRKGTRTLPPRSWFGF